MRPPKAKVHLLDVAEPLLAYHKLEMRCHQILHTAEPMFMVEESSDLAEAVKNAMGTCRECKRLEPEGENRRRYTYGLMEAQEAKTLEAA